MNKNRKYLLFSIVALMLIFSSAFTPIAYAETGKAEAITAAKASFADLYEEVNPSVVYIAVKVPMESSQEDSLNFNFDDFFGPELKKYFEQEYKNNDKRQDFGIPQDNKSDKEEPQEFSYGSGTGFVWDDKGHIVTNNHVIENAVEITVTYHDGIERNAKVVGADPDSDLAVIKVEDFKTDLKPVIMGDSTKIRPGDLTAAIGNPFGNTGTMTQGIVSALGRSFQVENGDENGNYSIPDVIQTDAAINPGNSGGILLNVDGEVIGVVMAFSSTSHSSAGIGYAIPSALVNRIVPELVANGKYSHPWIGISGIKLTPTINKELELDHDQRGAYVQTIQPGSPAEKAGITGGSEEIKVSFGKIRTGGDIVTKINDETVTGMDDIIAYLGSHTSVGDTITLHVIHDNGKEEDIPLTLKARPTAKEREIAATDKNQQPTATEGSAYLGAYIVNLSEEILEGMNLPKNTTGVMVTTVSADSPASDGGLVPATEEKTINGKTVPYGGDIIQEIDGKAIGNVDELKSEITAHLPGERVTLTILRDGEKKEIRLTLGNTLIR